jgi:hypothetical protein
MRLDINLASSRYEDVREFWTRWGLGAGVLGLLSLLLLSFALRGWINAGRDRHTIRQLQTQIAERDAEREQAQAFLELPANRSTRDQSQFLNSLIGRKAFSWTQVFADLERVMPTTLHVVSLKPELNDENQLQLEMKVAGDSRAVVLELVHRMESSPHFQGTQLDAENSNTDNTAGVTAEISAVYVPDQPERSGK